MIRVGQTLYGYCGGHFKGSYSDKIIEAVGVDWVVARDESGMIWFAEFQGDCWSVSSLEQYLIPESDR